MCVQESWKGNTISVIIKGADKVNFLFDGTSFIWGAIYVINRYSMRERLGFESFPFYEFGIDELSHDNAVSVD